MSEDGSIKYQRNQKGDLRVHIRCSQADNCWVETPKPASQSPSTCMITPLMEKGNDLPSHQTPQFNNAESQVSISLELVNIYDKDLWTTKNYQNFSIYYGLQSHNSPVDLLQASWQIKWVSPVADLFHHFCVHYIWDPVFYISGLNLLQKVFEVRCSNYGVWKCRL